MFDITLVFGWLKKRFTKKDLLLFACLFILFAATRLIRLDQFPIFSDEGIYIHWAKIAWKDASWRFVSLTDGRQPLQTWATILFLKMFPDNALLAGRLFSVATGFLALAGVFSFLFYLFGKKTAYIGTVLYTLNPYFLFYDRIALVDSAVNAGSIWIIFFSILLVKNRGLDKALLLGLISGAFLLAKSSVRLFLGISAFAPIVIFDKKNKKNTNHIINYYFLLLLSVSLAVAIYNIQRLSPFFHFVSQKNLTFVMSFQEFLQNPFAVFLANGRLIPQYISWELGFFIVPFALGGMFLLFKNNVRLFFYLMMWLFVPYFVIAFFSKVLFPRYVLFMGTILVMFAGYFFSQLKNKHIFSLFFILLLASFLYFDYPILFNPSLLHFPPIDRGQYVMGRTAGWGMKEIVEYARQKSKTKRVVILAEGDFGLSKDVLEAFVKSSDNIFLKGYWPLEKPQLLDNQKELKNNFVYAVFAHTEVFPSDWPLQLIKRFDKPDGDSSLYLFELTP